MRPWNATGQRPSTASRTSSTIWPDDISTVRMPCRLPLSRASSRSGNGHRVIGRNRPTRMPSREPERWRYERRGRPCRKPRSQTRHRPAASLPNGPHVGQSRGTCAAGPGFAFRALPAPGLSTSQPARPAGSAGEGPVKGVAFGRPESQFDRLHRLTRIPSATSITGVRYFSASSKDSAISSVASPIDAGARTGTR